MTTEDPKKQLKFRRDRLDPSQWRLAGVCFIIGLLAGAVVCFYRWSIAAGTSFARQMYAAIAAQPLLLIPWAVGVVAVGYLVYRLVKWEPTAGGSGIPQVKGTAMLDLKMPWAKVLAARLSGGIMCGLFGLSLGREGPSVHLGAAAAKSVADHCSRDGTEKRAMITGGAAAGISAAFNAPISGIIFALEEIHHNFSSVVLLCSMAAALAGDVISMAIFGMTPVLQFVTIPTLALGDYIWLLPLGLLIGLLGALINQLLINSRRLYTKLPAWSAPVCALAIALPFGLYLPEVLGGGEGLVRLAEEAETGLALVIALLVAKLVFTTTSFGSGVPGGIFMPILAIGALGGGAVGLVAVACGMPHMYVPDFAVLGMAGALASSVRAPITAIMLITEMTGSLVHLLPLALCVMIAYLVSGLLRTQPIYDVLLERYLGRHPEAVTSDGKPVVLPPNQ